MCEHADIVLTGSESQLAQCVDLVRAKTTNTKLLVINCTPFGESGPWSRYKAPDLVAGALGGSAALTGDVDTPPLKLWGDLNFMVPGCYVAVAALAGFYHANKKQEGQSVQVPVHECIASCLEHALMWYFCHEYFPQSYHRVLPRRGSLHWTDLYQVMQTQEGSVMITPLPSADSQLAWLIEEDAFEDLLDPEFQIPGAARNYMLRMMEILRKWATSKEGRDLFEQAQTRHLPYGFVSHVNDVAENTQLAARNWWGSYVVGGRRVTGVGAPYQFSKTPVEIREQETLSENDGNVLDLVGWSQ